MSGGEMAASSAEPMAEAGEGEEASDTVAELDREFERPRPMQRQFSTVNKDSAVLPDSEVELEEDTAAQRDSMQPSDTQRVHDWVTFVMEPVPAGGVVYCHIIRTKEGFGVAYKLFLERSTGPKLILEARKVKASRSANYHIFTPLSSTDYFGKLRCAGKHEFEIFDGGDNPKRFSKNQNGHVRKQLGLLFYRMDGASDGPRQMTCLYPKHGVTLEMSLRDYHKRNKLEQMHVLVNRMPKWNEQLQCYCLKFKGKGRVSMASAKNFMLIDPVGNENHVFLQFGKQTETQFTLDFRYPMTAFQSFATALSSFDL